MYGSLGDFESISVLMRKMECDSQMWEKEKSVSSTGSLPKTSLNPTKWGHRFLGAIHQAQNFHCTILLFFSHA